MLLNRMAFPRQAASGCVLAVILILGALLRFAELPQRGFIYWDEGKFALEGIRLLSVTDSLLHVHPVVLAGKAVGTAKPTHALLIAAGYGMFGIHDYIPLLMDACASVLALAALFALARELFGNRVALLATAFLAVSGYDIIYARSALSESDADALFLIGVLLWWKSRRVRDARLQTSWNIAAPSLYGGLALGLAFTTNYRLIVYIVTLVGFDVVAVWRRGGWRGAAISVTAWSIGFAVAPLIWEVIGVLAQAHGAVLFRSETTNQPTSYGAEVMYQLHGGRQAAIRFSPLPYLQWYVVRQGWPLSILVVVGLAVAAFVRNNRQMFTSALVVVPFVVYMFAPFIVPRNLDATLPFTAILAASGLAALIDRIRQPELGRGMLLLCAVALAIFGAVRAWPLTGVRSGFAQAAGYVEQRRMANVLVFNEVMRFYLRDPGHGCDAPRLPGTLAALEAADRIGVEYAVIDKYTRPIPRYLAFHARRVAGYSTIGASIPGEDLIASENGAPPLSGVEYVGVYSLDSLHLRFRPGVAAPKTCSLEELG